VAGDVSVLTEEGLGVGQGKTDAKFVVATFEEARNPKSHINGVPAQPTVMTYEETEKGHGRMERRIVSVTKDLRRISMRERWANLKCLVQVTRERSILSTRKASTERRATSPVTQNSRR
jgi:hypothetical protein